jgi:tetratricopeptide (TPR) repeat protein
MILKRILFVVVAAVCLSLFSISAPAQVGANATWRVQKYDINATLPQDDRSRSVMVRAILSVKNVSGSPANSLTLRISPLAEVTAVRINDATADFTKAEERVNPATALQRIGIRFASVPADAVITAAIDYKLDIKENSGAVAVTPVGGQFLPLGFWYPTPNSWFFTKGADSAPVRMKVSGLPNITVASSGAESSGGFDQSLHAQPFFVAGSWDKTELSGVIVYAPKGGGAESQRRAAELASLMSEARTFVEGLLGKAPPAPLRIISNRRGTGFSSGGTVIVDDAAFRRSKIDSGTAMSIAEAVARLWTVDNVRLSGEGHGVISEGLTRFIATQFIESKYGKDVADVERLRQRTAYAAVSKRDAPMATVTPIDDYYYPVVANKGAMVWRVIAKRIGANEFYNTLKTQMSDGDLNLAELRLAFAGQKDLLDVFLDRITETNLLAGIPVAGTGETKVALRNTGPTDVSVEVVGTTVTGERLTAPVTIRATNYAEIVFKSPNRVVRAEVDADKLYPQIDYSDDVAPRETSDNDPLLAAKRLFDKQDYAGAEKVAKSLLAGTPRFDDLRILLARSLLALGRSAEAEREFRAVLDEKLPTGRSLGWAYAGLAEVAAKAGQAEVARKAADAAILIDGDYGASFAARTLRSTLGTAGVSDSTVRTFFSEFDKAASANRRAEIDSMVLGGEVARFASGLVGSTEQWQTQVTHVDMLDPNTALVEAKMNIKLLSRDPESGLAVYRLVKFGQAWKLAGVEIFEVR